MQNTKEQCYFYYGYKKLFGEKIIMCDTVPSEYYIHYFSSFVFRYVCWMKFPKKFSVLSACFAFPIQGNTLAIWEARWEYWTTEILVKSDLHSPSYAQSRFATWPMKFMENMNLLNMPSNNF